MDGGESEVAAGRALLGGKLSGVTSPLLTATLLGIPLHDLGQATSQYLTAFDHVVLSRPTLFAHS